MVIFLFFFTYRLVAIMTRPKKQTIELLKEDKYQKITSTEFSRIFQYSDNNLTTEIEE